MRSHIAFIFLLFMLVSANALAFEATDNPGSHPLPAGSVMPDLLLRGELSPEHKTHLGLQGPPPYKLSEIKAKTVILVAVSMYCPHCQREAPILNELESLLHSRGLAQDVKLIGVGVGNSDFEIQVFRDKYAILFPLFSDPDFTVHKNMGTVGTPFFYVLNNDQTKQNILIMDTHLGRIQSAAEFLDRALKAAGR